MELEVSLPYPLQIATRPYYKLAESTPRYSTLILFPIY
jgi:hypothetical protein